MTASAIVKWYPLGGEPVEVASDPFERFSTIEIRVDGVKYPGVFDGERELVFEDVPEDRYDLATERRPRYPYLDRGGHLLLYRTAARELPLFAYEHAGRPDVVTTEDPDTHVSISATGMQALAVDDFFTLYSYNADALLVVRPGETSWPNIGATVVDGWTIAWQPTHNFGGWPLIDPSRGDDLWLGHMRGRRMIEAPNSAELLDPWSSAHVAVLGEAAPLSTTPMVAGEVTAASGAFIAAPTRTVEVDFRAGEFMAELARGSGSEVQRRCTVGVELEPGIEAPVIGMPPWLGSITVDSSDAPEGGSIGDRVLALEYGDPYPIGVELLTATCGVFTIVRNPKTGADHELYSQIMFIARIDDAVSQPVAPPLGMARAITVDGVPVGPEDVVEGVGSGPTIAFEPPTFGEPELYRVWISSTEPYFEAGPDAWQLRRFMSIETEDTSVTLPVGTLRRGAYYSVQVEAIDGKRLARRIPDRHEYSASLTTSGLFTP